MTGTLKIGEAVLSYQDGRLRISKGVVSDGDLAAFSAEEGEEGGSGGLDIARLWEELAAEDTSKVIDVSHIPGSVVLQDELVEILDDYPLTTEMNTALADKADLQHSHAITDITNLQAALSSKWVWNASQIAGVKVNNAVAADKLATARKINGTSFSGELDIVTDKWGNARTVTIWDYCSANKQATQGVDGSVNVNLLLPQSIKVKTLDVDGVTLSVVDGRLHISATATSAGDFVAFGDEEGSGGSGGLDISRLWDELRADDSSKVIDISHIPFIPTSKITGLDNALSGYVSSVTTSGAGNAVTGYAKSGNTLTLRKDLTFLTSVSLATISDLHSSWDAVLKVAKPAWLTAVSLATISDLNSSWDALLKVAPTKYVTRWPTASEVGALTQATADGRYLRLSGGTMSGDITFSAGAIYLGTADGFDRTIVGYNETSGAMLFFDGTRTVVGSYGAHSTAATHIRSKTGHATIGAGNTASYTILDTGNYTGVLDSRYVNVSGDTMTGPLKYIASTSRYLTLSESGLHWDFSDVTGGHAEGWLYVTEPDGSGYTGMGVYGGTDGLYYLFIGGRYTAPWIALRPSGNVGIGITSPAYKLHVGGNTYISGTIYASSSFNLTSSRGRFVFDSSSDATWLQGMEDKRLGISGFNGTTLPRLDLVSDDTYATGDFRVGGSVKIGSIILTDSGGRLHVSSTVTSDGDFVAFGAAAGSTSGGGLDVDRLWEELRADDSSKVIDESHLPLSVVLQDELTTTLSSYVKKTDFNSVIAGYLPLAGGTMSGDITMGTSHNIYGYNESSGSMLHFDGKRTVVGSCGAHSTAATHIRSKTGHATIGAGTTASYTMLDTGNYTSYVYSKPQADDRYFMLGRSVNKSVNSTYAGFIPPLVLAMMKGYGQIKDSEFESSVPIDKYDNNGSGKVTITRIADSTAGNSSGYVLKIHSSVSASPGGGGFTFQTVKAYKQTTCVFRAKIPAGYSIKFTTNSIGSGGGRVEWLTDNAGTGRWEWYACSVYFGSSPSSSHFYYLSTAADVDWYISFAQVYYNSSAAYAGVRTRYADALYSARTISLTGAVTGSASFDGSGNVSISTAYAAANISALDSRYVNVSGDTMTGPLTLNSDLNLSANSHIIFNRENFNYLSVPLNGTFAFAVGTTLNGANTVLGIDGGKVFPGYHNGTISLGSSSYRWSNVCSVAGNFSGDVSVSGDITGFASLLSKAGAGNRRTYISNSDFNHVAATTGWAFGLNVLTNDRSATLGTIAGAYGSGDNLSKYYYYGGSYTSPLMVIKPSGDVGIGTASPAYKFHVAGTGYFSSILTLGDSSGLDFVIGGTKRRAIYDDGTYAFYGDASYATGIRGSRIILQNAVGNTAVMIEDNDISFYGKLYIPSVDGNRKYYLRIA